jgi:hypothetical protein
VFEAAIHVVVAGAANVWRVRGRHDHPPGGCLDALGQEEGHLDAPVLEEPVQSNERLRLPLALYVVACHACSSYR